MEQNDKCCVVPKKKNGIVPGIIYGLFPHAFCMAFIVLSVTGAAIGAVFIKKLLLTPYFFYLLILISILFATMSAFLYLKRNGCLSCSGAKRKWKYITILYSTTVLINVLMFFVVFPVLANINNENPGIASNSELTLKVLIPCSGHASLIVDEVKKNNGVATISFEMPNIFNIGYDRNKTSTDRILSLDIFKTYKAILQ